MSNFHHEREVKATRKPHQCRQCEQRIPPGSRARVVSGNYYGDFYSDYEHHECGVAAHAYACEFDLWGEDYRALHEIDEAEDWRWLLAEHPIAGERIDCARRLAEHDAHNWTPRKAA